MIGEKAADMIRAEMRVTDRFVIARSVSDEAIQPSVVP
jgi:hypothetical protein